MNKAPIAAIAVALAIGVATQAQAQVTPVQEPFICTPDSAVGFMYDAGSKRWTQQSFDMTAQRYLLRALDFAGRDKANATGMKQAMPEAVFGVFDLTGNVTASLCALKSFIGTYSKCIAGNWLYDDFTFNQDYSKYEAYIPGEYVQDINLVGPRPDTPVLEIGRCAPLP